MDREAFAGRVTALQGSLYRVAAGYLRGESDRLDAVSEAIAKAWEKRGTLRDEALFATWLTRILIRECVNIQRRQRRSIPVETIPDAPCGEEDERIAALRGALERLPQRLRTMVVLHYMEGYGVQEIARIMGTTKGAVCAGLARTRGRLRAMLEEDEA
ncbi:MAG: RNA polymerase sigma factor [Candidatus Ventricola sp.]